MNDALKSLTKEYEKKLKITHNEVHLEIFEHWLFWEFVCDWQMKRLISINETFW
jgi:hypothetical protein